MKNESVLVSIAIVGLLIAGFFSYGNSMKNPFLYDDKPLIVENAFIRDFGNIGKVFCVDLHHFGSHKLKQDKKVSYYRPVIAVSFMADYFLWGLNSVGYHLTNILFHICNAFLIFILGQALARDTRAGIIAGLLFAVHPINTEAVTYISGRGDPLSLFFILLSLLFFMRYAENNEKAFSVPNLLSAACFALSLLTRENNIAFIFVLFAYLYIWRRSGKPYRYLYALLPHCIVLALFLALRLGIVGISVPLGLIRDPLPVRLMTLPKIVLEYLSLLLFPRDLHMNRTLAPVTSPFSAGFIVPFAVLLLIGIFIWRSAKKDNFLRFSVLWAVITFFPFSSIPAPLTTYIAEHWFYIPFAGVALMAGRYAVGWFDRFKEYRYVIAFALFAILTCYAIVTIGQNRHWKDEEAFYARMIRLEKSDYRSMINLASSMLSESRSNEAIKLFNAALGIMSKGEGGTELARYQFGGVYKALGDAYRAKGDPEKAIGYYKKAIDANPTYSDAYNELGGYYLSRGDEQGAVEAYEKSIRYSPNNWQSYVNLGRYYLEKNELRKAKYYWEKALELKPGFSDALYALDMIKKRNAVR